MSNFEELLPKVSNWDIDEEEQLINKIKSLTEDYQQKCSDLSINLNNINRNLNLLEVDFFNSLNGLKTLSGVKFIEHVVDQDEVSQPEEEQTPNPDFQDVKEDHFNIINNILQRSIDFINLKDQQKQSNKNNNNNNNNPDDDTASMNTSKILDAKNIKGLRLPLIIGTQDFNDNEYIGLYNPEDDEEDFTNEIKNEVNIGVEIPKAPELADNNNPEEFHNRLQQNMGGPIRTQSMFEESNEKEFVNPALANDDEDDNGLGGLLRKSVPLKNNLNGNNVGTNNVMGNNLMMGMGMGNNKPLPGIKGQIKIENFLSSNMFGDDDDDDTGLFSRPQRSIGGFNSNMSMNNNNMNMQMNNMQMQMSNVQMPMNNMNTNMVMPNQELIQNNNNNQSNEVLSEPNEQNQEINQGQKMNMVPNPLLQAAKLAQQQQQQNINIQNPNEEVLSNDINQNNTNIENNKPGNNIADFKQNLEKFFGGANKQAPQQQPKLDLQTNFTNNEQNINQANQMNQMMNQANQMNSNLNFTQPQTQIYQNNNNFISQKEAEKADKLEKAKSKLKSLFEDDDEDDDDLFSKNKASKIEEKSQNIQERLNQITSSFPSTSVNTNTNTQIKANDLFSVKPTNPVITNNNVDNKQTNPPTTKKLNFFNDDDDDEDFKFIKSKPNVNTNVTVNNEANINKQIIQPQNPSANLFVAQPQKPVEEKKPVSLFDNQPNNTNNKKSTMFLFEDNDAEKKEEPKKEIVVDNNISSVKPAVNLFNDEQKPVVSANTNIFANNNNVSSSKAPVNLFENVEVKKPEEKKAPVNLFENVEVKKPEENKGTVSLFDNMAITNTKPVQKKKLNLFFDDDDNKPAEPKIQQPVIIQPKPEIIQPKPEIIQPNPVNVQQQPALISPVVQPVIAQQPQPVVQPVIQTQDVSANVKKIISDPLSNNVVNKPVEQNINPPIKAKKKKDPLSMFLEEEEKKPEPKKPEVKKSNLFDFLDNDNKKESPIKQNPLNVQPSQPQPQIQQPKKINLFEEETIQQQKPIEKIQIPEKKPENIIQQNLNPPIKEDFALKARLSLEPNNLVKNEIKKEFIKQNVIQTNPIVNNTNTNTLNKINNTEEKPNEIKKTASQNKMNSRFAQMLEAQKLKESQRNEGRKPIPKKLDYNAKIAGISDLLSGRMSAGGNVFSMPVMRKSVADAGIIHENDESNEEKQTVTEINVDNAMIENAQIQETSYEKQLEKQKENAVVIKKKKPKKKNMFLSEESNNENNNNNNEQLNQNNLFEQPNQNNERKVSTNLFEQQNQNNSRKVSTNLFEQNNERKISTNLFEQSNQNNSKKVSTNLFEQNNERKISTNVNEQNNQNNSRKVSTNIIEQNNQNNSRKVSTNVNEQNSQNNSRKVSTNVNEQNSQNNSRKVSTNVEVGVNNTNKNSGNKKRGSFFDAGSNITTKQKAELISHNTVNETQTVHNAPVVSGVSFSTNASKINDLFKMPKPAHVKNVNTKNVLENTAPTKQVTASNLFTEPKQQPPQQPKLFEDIPQKEVKPSQVNNLFSDNNIISNTQNQQQQQPKQPQLFDIPKNTNENINVNVEIKPNTNQLNTNNLFDLPQTIKINKEAEERKSVTNLFADQLNAAKNPKQNLFAPPAQEPQKQTKSLAFLSEPDPIKEEPKPQIQSKVKNLFGDDDDNKPESSNAFKDPAKDKRLKFLFDDD